jgi:hypothetical protein
VVLALVVLLLMLLEVLVLILFFHQLLHLVEVVVALLLLTQLMVAVAEGGAKQKTALSMAGQELQIKVIEAAIQFLTLPLMVLAAVVQVQ